jgi:F-box and WD-40 domain protein 1/11
MERNWSQCRFKNFQFPHPDHSTESHTSDVYFLCSAGNHLVSCSRDTSVRIWDKTTQRLVLPPLLGHEASVLSAQVDQENDLLYTCGVDANVIVWKFSTGEIIKKVVKAHSESILSLVFNDQHLVTGSKDKTIKIWDRSTFLATRQMIGHAAAVNSVQITNKLIFSASGDGSIRIWDIETGGCLENIVNGRGITSLQLSIDGSKIYAASSDTSIHIFDLHGSRISCLKGHTKMVRRIQVDEHAQLPASTSETVLDQGHTKVRIVSASYDATIAIWHQDEDGHWQIQHRLNSDGTICHNPKAFSNQDELSKIFGLFVDELHIICSGNTGIIMGWDFDIP